MARPRIPIDLSEVERLAARGLSKRQICAALGISPDTLARRVTDDRTVTEALLRGRARGLADVASALFDKALAGDVAAQRFYLASRGGWELPTPRHTPQPNYDDRLDNRPRLPDLSPATVKAILDASYGKPR